MRIKSRPSPERSQQKKVTFQEPTMLSLSTHACDNIPEPHIARSTNMLHLC